MSDAPQFVIGREGSFQFTLANYSPWNGSTRRRRGVKIRLGWRCVCSIWPGQIEGAEAFVLRYRNGSQRFTLGHEVNISVEPHRKDESGYITMYLEVDIWTERTGSTSSDLTQATEALEAVRKEIGFELDLIQVSQELKIEQEFLEVKLPRFVARGLSADPAGCVIAPHLNRNVYNRNVWTARVDSNYLILGPEPHGTINAVRRYLEKEESDTAKDAILASAPYDKCRLIPLAMAAMLIFTWVFPLSPLSIAWVGVVMTGFMVLAVSPARVVGWRRIFRQTATVASLGFFGIALFGIGYAVCALISKDDLGDVKTLGYPFLIATGIGVAGGVLGDNPKGAARILAHIQLLLFLSGLIGAVAVLLRIDRGTRPRG